MSLRQQAEIEYLSPHLAALTFTAPNSRTISLVRVSRDDPPKFEQVLTVPPHSVLLNSDDEGRAGCMQFNDRGKPDRIVLVNNRGKVVRDMRVENRPCFLGEAGYLAGTADHAINLFPPVDFVFYDMKSRKLGSYAKERWTIRESTISRAGDFATIIGPLDLKADNRFLWFSPSGKLHQDIALPDCLGSATGEILLGEDLAVFQVLLGTKGQPVPGEPVKRALYLVRREGPPQVLNDIEAVGTPVLVGPDRVAFVGMDEARLFDTKNARWLKPVLKFGGQVNRGDRLVKDGLLWVTTFKDEKYFVEAVSLEDGKQRLREELPGLTGMPSGRRLFDEGDEIILVTPQRLFAIPCGGKDQAGDR
ncbi:MAG TPA: hypothetical protein PK280_02265 [Planctomycetota bacterium]|nr:hypothetical protein [Planctomycetota bacterium]